MFSTYDCRLRSRGPDERPIVPPNIEETALGVSRVWVHPSARRKGIATTLLHAVRYLQSFLLFLHCWTLAVVGLLCGSGIFVYLMHSYSFIELCTFQLVCAQAERGVRADVLSDAARVQRADAGRRVSRSQLYANTTLPNILRCGYSCDATGSDNC